MYIASYSLRIPRSLATRWQLQETTIDLGLYLDCFKATNQINP